MDPQHPLPHALSAPRTASQDTGTPRRGNLVSELKLLFAALGAGGRVVPLGDNHRTARLLAEYAAALRRA
jgi:hypothetical protein